MPAPYLMVEAADAATVSAARPDLEALAGMADVMGLFLFAGEVRVRARFFAPSAGVAEDPATGSAAVALAALRRWQGDMSGAFDVAQGEEIDHPSLIHCRWDGGRIVIGGTVVHDEVRVLDA